MAILELLLKEWKLALAGLFLIIAILMYGLYKHEYTKVQNLTMELAKVNVEYKDLDNSVKNQNKKIKDLNTKLNNKQKELDDLNIELAKERAKHQGYMTDFATSTIITKPTTTNCVNNQITRQDGSEEVNKQWLNLFQKF